MDGGGERRGEYRTARAWEGNVYTGAAPGPVLRCPLVPVTGAPVVASRLSVHWELERQLDLERQITCLII